MKRNANIRRVVSASLAFLVSSSPIARAMEGDVKKEEGGGSTKLLRDHDYYKEELRKLEESTSRIHKEVNRILTEFRRNMEEYYRRTRGTGTTAIAEVEARDEEVNADYEKMFVMIPETTDKKEHEKLFEALGESPKSAPGIIKDALYAKRLLGDLQLGKRSTEVVSKYRLGVKGRRPTEVEFFLMLTQDQFLHGSDTKKYELMKRYGTAKQQLQKLLKKDEKLHSVQICEWMRQKDNLKINDPKLEEINEGVRQHWKMKPGIEFPSMKKIREGLRLKGIGIQNPSKMQIIVGVHTKEKENQQILNQSVKVVEEKLKYLYSTDEDYYKFLLEDQRDTFQLEMDVVLVLRLPDVTRDERHEIINLLGYELSQGVDDIDKILDNHELEIEEFLRLKRLLKKGGRPSKEAVTEGLRLRKNVKIKDPSADQIAVGLMYPKKKKDNQKDIDDLVKSYLSSNYSDEIKRQKLDVLSEQPEQLLKMIKQGLKLGNNSSTGDIEEGVRLGGEATREQIAASFDASDILSVARKKGIVDRSSLENLDEVDAWIYLRDDLKQRIIADSSASDALSNYIPSIIQFKKKGNPKPTLIELGLESSPDRDLAPLLEKGILKRIEE